MNKSLTEDGVLTALKTVTLNGEAYDLVKQGQVSGVIIKDGNVGFSLEVDPSDKDAAQALRAAAEAAVAALPGVLSATAMLTAHRKPAQSQQTQPPQNGGMHQPATHVIAVASGKGGVGKSTTAINLALAIKNLGFSVGILDADIYGPSLPRLTGITKKPTTKDNKLIPLEAYGIKIMSIGFLLAEDAPTIWRGPMVMSAIEQMLKDVAWGDLDVMVIDMPPGTGDAQLTLSQRTRLSGAVIVSTPQDLALIDARKGLNMFVKVGVPVLGLIENMSHFICPECGAESHIFGQDGVKDEAAKLNLPLLGAVPLDIAIRKNADSGTPIVASDPDSPHSKIYAGIAKRIMEGVDTAAKPAPTITVG